MDCKEIEKTLPKYFNHTASEEEIKSVEEHLCVCHKCRVALGKLMDQLGGEPEPSKPEGEEMEVVPQKEGVTPPKKEEPKEEEPLIEKEEEELEIIPPEEGVTLPKEEEPKEELKPLPEEEETMEYFPGKDIEESLTEQKKPPLEEKEEPVVEKEPEPEEPEVKEPEVKEEVKEEEPEEEMQVLPPEPESPRKEEKISEPAPEPVKKPSEEKPGVAEEAMEAALTKAAAGGDVLPKEKEEYPSEEKELYPLDEYPLEKPSKIGLLEYVALGVGIIILLALMFIFMKG